MHTATRPWLRCVMRAIILSKAYSIKWSPSVMPRRGRFIPPNPVSNGWQQLAGAARHVSCFARSLRRLRHAAVRAFEPKGGVQRRPERLKRRAVRSGRWGGSTGPGPGAVGPGLGPGSRSRRSGTSSADRRPPALGTGHRSCLRAGDAVWDAKR